MGVNISYLIKGKALGAAFPLFTFPIILATIFLIADICDGFKNRLWRSMNMLNCLAVGLGGFVGSVLRYLVGKIPIKNPCGFPINTFLINILGSFVIGCIVAVAAKNLSINPRLMLFLKVGVCGGFTTFSTFSLESGELIKSGQILTAAVYAILSFALGVAAVLLGQYAVSR